MTITALIVGKLTADPEQRTGASGKTFTTARLAAGTDADSVLCSVIAFSTASERLAVLGKADTVALTGRCRPKSWAAMDGETKTGLDLVADQLLTAYHLKRKRQAMAGDGEAAEPAGH